MERTPLPAVVLELPSERIVVANPAAMQLLTGGRHDVAERYLEEFLSDAPSGGLELMRAGRVSGYETGRDLQRTQQRLQVWVRAVGTAVPVTHALAVMLPADDRAEAHLPPMQGADRRLVLGTTDAALHVERISSDVEALLGVPAQEVTGRSVLTLVDPRDAPTMLLGIAEAAMTGRAVTFSARGQRADDSDGRSGAGDGDTGVCQLMVMPLDPPPSVGFTVLAGDGLIHREDSQAQLLQLLHRLAQTIDAAATSRVTGDLAPSGEANDPLSSRELDIVGRLLAGDRVPAIARALFLSQSTVRNHLSAVFRKFGVSSQQELINVLRKKDGPSGRG
ncbi:MAG: helix-turn-helix transcriptional regulator [Actinomycetes bacterium]